MRYVHFLFLNCAIAHVLRDSFQVEENEDYAMGVPLKPINLGVEQPKPGDVAITAAHRAKRGIFNHVLDALLLCKFTLTFIFKKAAR